MRRGSIAFWLGVVVFLATAFIMTQTMRNEYPFFAGYVILQFVVLSVAWTILGGYAGYVNFGTNAFFGVGVYTAVLLIQAYGAPLGVQILVAAIMGGLLGLGVGLLTLRMRGIFFSIATIALAIIIETAITNWRFVGGAAGIQLQRPPVMPPLKARVWTALVPVTALGPFTVAVPVQVKVKPALPVSVTLLLKVMLPPPAVVVMMPSVLPKATVPLPVELMTLTAAVTASNSRPLLMVRVKPLRSSVPPAVKMRRHYPLARRGRVGLIVSYGVRPIRLLRLSPRALRVWSRARRAARSR